MYPRRTHYHQPTGLATESDTASEDSSGRRAYTRDAVRRHRARGNEVTIPRVRSYSRRAACRRDLHRFCRIYLSAACCDPMSDDHLRVIAKLQSAILRGGRFALAMPRGHGKTTLCIAAVTWAMIYGHRRYIVVIGADLDAAKNILAAVQSGIENNLKIQQDFPALCAPIEHAEGIPQRARNITVDGVNVAMTWSTTRIVCPTVQDSYSSGVIVQPFGLTGRLRGAFHKLPDGSIVRPDLALLDDPQTDESAKSPTQCDYREKLIKEAVLGMAGPRKRIAAVMPCTVVASADLSDRILDREKNPEWQAIRTQLVCAWPDEQDGMWAQYREIRRDALLQGDEHAAAATEFYRSHRDDMDRGARVAWEQRYNDDEISALQHAQNLLMDMGDGFWAEHQQDPRATLSHLYELDADIVMHQLDGLAPRQVPERATILVGFVDINRYGLHWVVAAYRLDAAGYVVDYGVYPPGEKLLFVGDGSDGCTEEQAVYRALDVLGMSIVRDRQYTRGDRRKRLDLLLIDCGYLMQTVFDFVDHTRIPTTVLPSRGFGSTRYRPSAKYGPVGDGWHVSEFAGKGKVLCHNADYWRAKSQRGWLQPVGGPGSMALFGDDPNRHAELARQATREKLLDIEEKGITDVYRWESPTSQWHDLGDCITGVCVAAAHLGASDSPAKTSRRKKPERRRKCKVPLKEGRR